MKGFNIYLTGVGGQGIGLISEIILRAADHGGHPVKSVDTHGLAQRGGIVASQIRMGDKVFSPLIPAGQADLVVSLERHEALRAAGTVLKANGCLIYYNTVWQPLSVRLSEAAVVTEKDIQDLCSQADRIYRGAQLMGKVIDKFVGGGNDFALPVVGPEHPQDYDKDPCQKQEAWQGQAAEL